MKTIARIFILLAAAMIIVGALVLLQNRGILGGLTGGEGAFARGEGHMRPGMEFGAGGFENRQFSEGSGRHIEGFEGRGGREGRDGLSAFTWVSLAKNFGIIAAIGVVYALLDRFILRRKRKPEPAAG